MDRYKKRKRTGSGRPVVIRRDKGDDFIKADESKYSEVLKARRGVTES